MINLYWVGPRLSDIRGIENLFKGALVLFGYKENTLLSIYSYEHMKNIRINHNNENYLESSMNYIRESILKIIKLDKNAYFMFYNDNQIPNDEQIIKRSFFNNKILLNILSDKFKIRSLLSPIIKTLNSKIFFTNELSYDFLQTKYNSNAFIVQTLHGAGGNSTFYLFSKDDNIIFNKINSIECIVSEFIKEAVPVNVHIFIKNNGIEIFPPSVQIIEKNNNNMLYSGADFISFNELVSNSQKKQLLDYSKQIANKLSSLEYQGILGIDFLVTKDEIHFIEINPRFQASTFLLNDFLIANKQPSIQELQLSLYEGSESTIDIDFFQQISKSFFSILYSENINTNIIHKKNYTSKSPDIRNSKFNKSKLNLEIIHNDFSSNYSIENNAIFSYMIFDFNAIYKSFLTNEIEIVEHIKRFITTKSNKFTNINKKDNKLKAFLKFELLTYGAQLSESAKDKLYSSRKFLTIRDGIAGGIEVVVFDNIHINIPIKEKFTFISPYKIEYNDQNKFFITCENDFILSIKILPLPLFVTEQTQSGKDFISIGQLMNDRLGLYPYSGCKNNKNNACGFCEIGNFEKFNINQIVDMIDLIKYSLLHDVNMKHILISGGTPFDDNWSYFLEVLKEIRKITNIKIYQMLEPTDKKLIYNLYKFGLNEIGFNIEIYDRELSKLIMPQKGKISLDKYLDCLEYATTLWGKNGNVRSILIVGLEPIESTLKGVEVLAKMGVMPILSPFRPVENTLLHNYSTPSSELLLEVWSKASKIVKKYNMILGPSCIACQNNTIALPVNDKYNYY